MPVIKLFEDLNGNSTNPCGDEKGHYTPAKIAEYKYTQFIFGANIGHFYNRGVGGGAQAEATFNARNVFPVDTMYYADHEAMENEGLKTPKGEPVKLTRSQLYKIHQYCADVAMDCTSLDFVFPMKKLSSYDLGKLKSSKEEVYFKGKIYRNERQKEDIRTNWCNNLKEGQELINIGYGLCSSPDLKVISWADQLVNTLDKHHKEYGKKNPTNKEKDNDLRKWNDAMDAVAEFANGGFIGDIKKNTVYNTGKQDEVIQENQPIEFPPPPPLINQKKPKVYFHFDIEGVLLGNQNSKITAPNQHYLNGINKLKDEGYDVNVDICSIAQCGADGGTEFYKAMKALVGDEKNGDKKNILQFSCRDILNPQMYVNKTEGTVPFAELMKGEIGTHIRQLDNDVIPADDEKPWFKPPKGEAFYPFRDRNDINTYNKANMSLFMMLYRKNILGEDIRNSVLYFVDNDWGHINTFTDRIKEAFKELGVTVHTIGVENYIDHNGETQATHSIPIMVKGMDDKGKECSVCARDAKEKIKTEPSSRCNTANDGKGKGTVADIETDEEFEKNILTQVHNDTSQLIQQLQQEELDNSKIQDKETQRKQDPQQQDRKNQEEASALKMVRDRQTKKEELDNSKIQDKETQRKQEKEDSRKRQQRKKLNYLQQKNNNHKRKWLFCKLSAQQRLKTSHQQNEHYKRKINIKLKALLEKLHRRFKKLTRKDIIGIFTESKGTAPSKLKRQFSVAFQKECGKAKLNFSNTCKSWENKHGMRTKSALAFIGGNHDNLKKLVGSIFKV